MMRVCCRIVHLLISKTGCCQILHYSQVFQNNLGFFGEINLQDNSFSSPMQQTLFTLDFVFQYPFGFDYNFLV